MTASRPAPRAFALPAFVLPALALLMVAAPLAVPDAARAQTPAATIENASGKVVLESYDGGALLAPNNDTVVGTGAIPAEGAGVRMMWYPGKAAFRAGQVIGDAWNDSNIGFGSVAFGYNTTASAVSSTAMGSNTTASGEESLAVGDRAAAEAADSFVWNDEGEYHDIPNTNSDGLSSNTAVSGEPVTGDRTFSVSAQGGVRFITGSSSVTYIDGDGSIEQDLEDGHGGVRVTATLGHGTETSLTLSLLSNGEVIDETSEPNTEHGARVYAVEAGEIPDFSEE